MEESRNSGKTAPRKTDRRTLYTRQVIREAYLRLLGKETWDKISITKLCKLAEINRSTFYLHYSTSTDVLDELLWELYEEFIEELAHVESMEERHRVSAVLFQKILKDRRMSFLMKVGMSYPPFLERICEKMVEIDMERFRGKPGLSEEELKTTLFALYYGYLSLENYWSAHASLKKIDAYGQLYEKYVMTPCYKSIFED